MTEPGHPRYAIIALMFAWLATTSIEAGAASNEWVMPGLTTQWIARDMDINGIPAAMRTIRGNQSIDDVLQFYRQAWAGAIDERKEGDWHVLSTRQRDQFVSLRLRRSGSGVDGVLTTSLDPGKASPNLASTLPVPPGLTRLSHQVFRDEGSQGEILALMSRRSVAYERQAFAALYRSKQWTLVEDRFTRTVVDGHILQFLRDKQQLRIVLYRDSDLASGQTLILITAHRD